MLKFTTLQIFVILIFVITSIFTINYFAEVNRSILLFGVYPACFFTGLGICAWIEK